MRIRRFTTNCSKSCAGWPDRFRKRSTKRWRSRESEAARNGTLSVEPGRLAQPVRAPALQAARPSPKPLQIYLHFQDFQLGESAFRSKATQDRSVQTVLSQFCHGRLGNG